MNDKLIRPLNREIIAALAEREGFSLSGRRVAAALTKAPGWTEGLSALLPIRKRDTVKANCLFVGLIELLALVIAVPFALLRAKLGIGDNPVGLNANVTLFACGLMLFAVFNAVFLLSFYRTAYKVGVSFVKACIVMAVAAFIMEAVVHFPALSRFNGYDLACQLPLLAAGLVIWCGSWPLIFRGAAARYEKVDL